MMKTSDWYPMQVATKNYITQTIQSTHVHIQRIAFQQNKTKQSLLYSVINLKCKELNEHEMKLKQLTYKYTKLQMEYVTNDKIWNNEYRLLLYQIKQISRNQIRYTMKQLALRTISLQCNRTDGNHQQN